jgi:hypothetical protein
MAALPRGKCSVCERLVPVRRGGDAREHNDQGRTTTYRSAGALCAGSGLPVAATVVHGVVVPRPSAPVMPSFEEWQASRPASVQLGLFAGVR